jgi:ribosomal protein S6
MAVETVETKEEIEGTDKSYVYELGFHLLPTIAEENLPAEVATMKSLIEKVGGSSISEEFPKLTQLAYTMIPAYSGGKDTYDSAYFGWIKFEASRQGVVELQESLTKNAGMLRYIILKTVRESTLAPRRAIVGKTETEPRVSSPRITAPRKEAPSASSVAEIDKVVEELVEQTRE